PSAAVDRPIGGSGETAPEEYDPVVGEGDIDIAAVDVPARPFVPGNHPGGILDHGRGHRFSSPAVPVLSCYRHSQMERRMAQPGPRNLITDVPGVLVGQAQDMAGVTGTSVVLCEAPAVAAVDVRGGAPGSRETELLRSATLVERVDAIVLSGGSAFGLDAAAGVMAGLAAIGRGFPIRETRVPIVPAAILFVLAFPGRTPWAGEPPYRALGRTALARA